MNDFPRWLVGRDRWLPHSVVSSVQCCDVYMEPDGKPVSKS